jgi:hypothetical protein
VMSRWTAKEAERENAKLKIKPNQRAEILRMVNLGKTSAAEAARLFGLQWSAFLDWSHRPAQ